MHWAGGQVSVGIPDPMRRAAGMMRGALTPADTSAQAATPSPVPDTSDPAGEKCRPAACGGHE